MTTVKSLTLTRAAIVLRAKQGNPDNGTGRLIANGKPMIHVHCTMTGDTMTVTAHPCVTHRAGILAAGTPITLATGLPVSSADDRDKEARRLCSSKISTDVPVKWIKK